MNHNYAIKALGVLLVAFISTKALSQNTITWSGASNVFTWNDNGNWVGGVKPAAGDNVIIPGGLAKDKYPSPIFETLTVNSVTLEPGAFIVNGFGAKIAGQVTYKQQLTTANWYLMASPVIGQTIENLLLNHNFANGVINANHKGIGSYDPATPGWSYATTATTGVLTPAVGKSIKLSTAGQVTFTGTYNDRDSQTVTLQQGSNGFNLIGNPFIAPVFANDDAADSFTDLLDTNSGILEEATLWLWNQATSRYETINNATPVKSIGVAQGFFVKLKSGSATGNFKFEQGMQGAARGNNFQRQAKPEISLRIKQGKKSRATALYFYPNASKGFDNGYDGTLFDLETSELEIYSQLVQNNKGKNFAVQSLPNSNYEELIIPIGLIAKKGEAIEFSAVAGTFPKGIDVYLEDRIQGAFTKITEEHYVTTLTEDARGIGQFYLHTSSKALSSTTVNPVSQDISMYINANNELNIVGLRTKQATLSMFTTTGQRVLTRSLQSDGVSTLSLPDLSTGVYLITLTSSSGSIHQKIVIK